MLGRHADAFFAKQMNEQILANSPNGMAGSIAFPDRELAGTGKISHVSGQYEMPGPQTVVMGNSMLPGMQGGEMMPGMGSGEMMPGMGSGEMLPGMGMFPLDTKTKVLLGGIGVGVVLLMMRMTKKRGGSRRR